MQPLCEKISKTLIENDRKNKKLIDNKPSNLV